MEEELELVPLAEADDDDASINASESALGEKEF